MSGLSSALVFARLRSPRCWIPLLVAVICAAGLTPWLGRAAHADVGTTVTVTVPMTATPTDTGVAVQAGDVVQLAASGSASCTTHWDCASTPDGLTGGGFYDSNGCAHIQGNAACPDAVDQIGSLVYAIGTSAPTTPGSFSYAGAARTITAAADGDLFLMINDGFWTQNGYGDDFGSYTVTLTTLAAPTSTPPADPRVLSVPAYAKTPVLTGEILTAGQQVEVTASGSANCGNSDCESDPFGVSNPSSHYYDPNGCLDWETTVNNGTTDCLADGAPIGALVYAVGVTTEQANAFQAVPGNGIITAPADGELVLMYNDVLGSNVDNSGTYAVAVTNPVPDVTPTMATVPANASTAIDSGLSVTRGEEVHLTAAGVQMCAGSTNDQCLTDSDGAVSGQTFHYAQGCAGWLSVNQTNGSCPDGDAQMGSLVYGVGDPGSAPTNPDDTFSAIGRNGTVTANRSGELYLLVNDANGFTGDNQGSFTVVLQPAGSSGYADAVLADQPSLYYRLGESRTTLGALDSSGNSDDAAYTTAATLGQAGAVAGDTDNAVSGDGSGPVVTEVSGTGLPTGGAPRTVEMWFSTTSQSTQRLWVYGSGVDNQMFQATLQPPQQEGGDTTVTAFYWSTGDSWTVPGDLADGQWHDLALTYDGDVGHGGTNTVIAFVDGKAISAKSCNCGSMNTAAGPLEVGDGLWAPEGTTAFDGSIDEFAIYPTALTDDRLTAHYQAALASVPSEPTDVVVTPGDGSASVAFDPPAQIGSSAISRYTATAHPDDLPSSDKSQDVTTAENGSPILLPGLTNGTLYDISLWATNDAGDGVVYNTTVTPRTVPGTPTDVVATVENAATSVSFTAPDDGGATIDSYTVVAHPDGVDGTALDQSASGTDSPIAISGLTNGTLYDISVVAANVAGSGAPGTTTVTPITVPGAPSDVAASVADGQSVVSFVPPTDDGGSAITGYSVTAHPDTLGSDTSHDITVSGDGSPITVTGLTDGTLYDITVVATNAAGPGTAGTTSVQPTAPVIISGPTVTAPGAPHDLVATPGNTIATLAFSAPLTDGGTPVTSYLVTAHPHGAPNTASDKTASGAVSPLTVTGLVNGVTYDVSVVAINAIGAGPAATASVTPATVPGAPTGISAVASAHRATVTFTPPSDNGGARIVGFSVIAHPHGASGTSGDVSARGTAAPITLTGLEPGVLYDLHVTATNAVGTGPAGSGSVRTLMPTKLSVSATPARLTLGGDATLRGVLRTAAGKGLNGQQLVVTATSSTGAVHTTRVGTARVNRRSGAWSLTVSPSHRTRYVVAFAGTDRYGTSLAQLTLHVKRGR